MTLVDVGVDDGVATLTLRDGRRRNALTLDMVDEIVAAVDRLEGDDTVGALVVTGEPPAFCAGADLSHLGSAGADAGLRRIYEGFLRIGRCALPTIAAVNGAAVGAGMNLALCCDVRLAATTAARFDTRFLELGLHPGGGHTWMLHRAVGPQAAAAAVLFGEVLDGPTAERIGLVWRCVDDDALLDVAGELGRRTAAAPRELVKRTKASLRAAPSWTTHDEAVDAELVPQVWSLQQPAAAERLRAMQQRITKSG